MNDVMGGKNLLDLFRFKINAGKTAWVLQSKLTDTAATTPAPSEAALRIIGAIGSTKPQPQESGLVNLEVDQYEASDIWPFLDKVAVPTTAGVRPEKILEDKTRIGGAGSSDEIVVAVSYLFYDNDTTPTKIFVYPIAGDIDKTSGSFSTSGEDYVMPTLKLTGKAVPYADLEIPAACFDSSLVTVSAAVTIAKSTNHKRQFFPIAS